MMMDPLFTTTIANFLAVLFLLTGMHKVANPEQFKASMAAYQLVTPGVINITALILIVSELSIGGMLLITSTKQWAAICAMLIFGLYLSVMAVNISRGRKDLHCGCSVLARETPLSYWHLARNVILIGLTVLILIPETERALNWLDIIQIAAGVTSLSILYLSVDALLSSRIYFIQEEVE